MILRDLTKLRYAIRKSLQPATVIGSLELICGGNYSIEKADQVISAGWALDPVHPTKHIHICEGGTKSHRENSIRQQAADIRPDRREEENMEC